MFSNFPIFTELTLEDKDRYNSFISTYPPISDISFATLFIWWRLGGRVTVSNLNENLIINYQLPFDDKNSGISIVGTHLIDSSIETIFDYLEKGKASNTDAIKLIHVPEFVIKKIQHLEHLKIEEEVDYNEYIIESSALASLENPDLGRIRRKINRFLREVEERNIETRVLDLASEEARTLLVNSIEAWQKKFPKQNDPNNTEAQAFQSTLANAVVFDTQNLALFVDGELNGIVLYHVSTDAQYYILNHLKVDYSIPFIFDYLTYLIASEASKNGIPYLNMEMDLGIEGLRRHKMGLRPVDFFRKYTIEKN